MKYKLKSGGIIKFQNAGSLPRWMQKLNSWSIPDSDESAGERILNSTIEQANDASTQEERDQIYKDSAKKNLAVTGQSLMMIPMLNEFATYGLLGGGLRLGAGMAGSKAGEYVLGKGGDWLDKQLHTKFLGTTGRIFGGLGGWWGGSSATTPLFRNLAGKGITLHIPQETFMNLRSQYFNNAASRATVNSKPNPTLTSTINHLYKEHPELSSIGPKEAYRQYYETIFPASKVQTPYAHGTKSDLSGGLEASTKVPNAAAPETIGRNDFYLNLQPEASLQYADGIGVPKGFTWNKHRFWPLKEILGKPYESDTWMSKPIKLREQVPNRAGQFSRVKNADGTYSGHGKLLEEYKAELGMQDLSNEEFLQKLGVQNEESFNQWVAKNKQMFSNIYDSGDYHGLYHVKIDARKPLTINGGNTYYSERGIWNRMNKGGNDVLLHNNAANEFGSDVAVVRDVTPQKVRILGSKQDQQGFADFMGGKQRFFTEIPTFPQEAATTYHFDGRMPLTRPISFKERLGWTRGERMQSDPKNPIPISLINRSDSYLPIEGDSFVLESPEISKKLASVHFTMNEPVTGHGGGSWDSASTTLLFPYGNIRKVTGPINIEPMDTFFPNYNGLRFSTKGAKVLTGDRAVHDYYTQHGVDSKFSEELEALLKEYKSKAGSAEKYLEEHNWLPDEGYFPLRDAETALSDRIQQIHYDFVDQNAVRPTYEDLLKLEKIEGLKTGAEPLSWSTMRTPLEDKLGYSYFSAPATHSNLTFYDPGDNISGLPKPMQEFIKWMWEHKADYRKQGGIIKGQDGVPEISGGELQPAIVKPAPVKIVLRTDPITKDTPITHSSLHAPDFFVSKGSDDPTYNFLKANCSDATGEVLELFTGQDFTSGITTPIGVSRKVRKIYGSKPGYSERKMTSRYQEFEVPWYDYRRAKDLINYNTLQTILNKYNPKPNVKANIIANWAKERPTLPYYLDEDNNVHYYKE